MVNNTHVEDREGTFVEHRLDDRYGYDNLNFRPRRVSA